MTRACLIIIPLVFCGASASGQLSFSDRTADAQVEAYQIPFGYPSLGVMMGGGAAADFNRDGLMDLYVVRGSFFADCLYINNGDGTFTDMAASAGMSDILLSAGAAVGDYNNDGHVDIYVLNHGDPTNGAQIGKHRLYRNNGDGTFTDVAVAAGVSTTSSLIADGFGATFGDYDGDGDLDLAVAGWIQFAQGNRLFRNNGDGTFTDVTTTAVPSGLDDVRGFSIRMTDMDGDHRPELLWVGDFITSRYLVNNGDGTFADMTLASGTGIDENGMGSAVGDFNGDGLLDWFVTAIYGETPSFPYVEGNRLYMNQGNHVYTELALESGIDDGGWGWGTVPIDFDHDGDQDIVHTNGWTTYPLWREDPMRFYLNDGAANFTEIAPSIGLTHTGQGRGLVNLDYENDGDQDIVVFCHNEEMILYRNDLAGPDTNWLRLFFDTSGEPDLAPDGFGTHVTITVGGTSQVRVMDGGCNYLSVSEFSTHFGLGSATVVDEVHVEWANGRFTRMTNVSANQTMTVVACLLDGDADGSGSVDFTDLNTVLGAWGTMVDPYHGGDVTGDGLVDFTDLNAILGTWGQTCP